MPVFTSKRVLALLLLVSALAVYWRVTNHGFVAFDDGLYVVDNAHVQAGLSTQNTLWALKSASAGNWHPLTWLSYMLDYELYGLNARGYHLTNLLFHLANSVLLFLVLCRMTGAQGRSAFVAALFGLHPLHVESVAWIAERKDVLCGLFFMLTLYAYARYTERPSSLARYLQVCLWLVLGLMAKPMLVTLPCVLLLLDFWPLARCASSESERLFEPARVRRLTLEKLPLFLIVGASCVITWAIQHASRATSLVEGLTLDLRIWNTLLAYLGYVSRFLWPQNLAIFYPHPGQSVSIAAALASALLLIEISGLALRVARHRPYLAVGWFWYLGTLVPVIGLVQIGEQAMADRYMYLPLIGLAIMLAWGVPDLVARWRYPKALLPLAASLVLASAALLTWKQVGHWRDSVSLFERALQVTSRNHLAHTNLGVALTDREEYERAIHHYMEAIEIAPGYPAAHYNLATTLVRQDRCAEAIVHYALALRIRPDQVTRRVPLARCAEDST